MMHIKYAALGAVALVLVALTGGAAVGASPGDAPTAAGNGVGSIVAVGPAINTTLGINTAPGINAARGTAPSITILTPTQATGSFVVPVRIPSALGTGPSVTRFEVIVPGPNPAQNTPVALSQLLSALLGPAGGPPPAVYRVPAVAPPSPVP